MATTESNSAIWTGRIRLQGNRVGIRYLIWIITATCVGQMRMFRTVTVHRKGILAGSQANLAPSGNSNAEGNPGSQDAVPPDRNANAMEHGLHMTAERLLEVMDEQQREVVKGNFLEYRKSA